MQSEFNITVDPDHDLVRITLRGFFEMADIERFLIARDKAHKQLRSAPNQHATLVDIRDMKIQSQEIVAAFRHVLANPAHQSRRLAFVIASTLARMQVIRAVDEREARYFGTMEEAEAWVLGNAEQESAERGICAA